MRSIAIPEGHDASRLDGLRSQRYVLDTTPAVRPSSWAIVLLIFGVAGGLAYLAIDRAGGGAHAAAATATPPSIPAEQPGIPPEPAAAPAVAAAGTTEATTAEPPSAEETENTPSQPGLEPPSAAIADDRSVDELVGESRAASERGEHRAALAAAEAAVALDANNAQALLAQGRADFELKQLEAAERALVRSIDVDPVNADARNLLGLVYLEQGRSREALAVFQEAATLAPDLEAIRQNLERARERVATETTSEPSP
jgi:tetratricopeptide (TPR) repeat protein